MNDPNIKDATFSVGEAALTHRITVPAMERLMMPEAVTYLLNGGFIRVVDYMGGDAAVVQAARVSYGQGTKGSSDDRGLIRYLLNHYHTTPFEMCELKLHCKLPVFVARQWIRHRTANVNELSGRYSIMPEEFFLPDLDRLGRQSKTNKQGTGDEGYSEIEALSIRDRMGETAESCFRIYDGLVNEDTDLARELARTVLPMSTYTEWYWKIDVHNLMHFLRLRADSHAQYEIRVYAEAMMDIFRAWMPLSMEAFKDYVVDSVKFSGPEMRMLLEMLKPEFGGFVDPALANALSKRELDDFRKKVGLGE